MGAPGVEVEARTAGSRGLVPPPWDEDPLGRPDGSAERVPDDQPIVITIDGPAGTGKSTVARRLADRLGLDFLDTGAMYRAATAIIIDENLDLADVDAVVERVASADLHFDWSRDPPVVMAWFRPLDHRIRDDDVTRMVSRVAGYGPLRRHMVRKQQIIAHQHPRLVTEGRDQGSVVFPSAPMKFYLDAAPQIRARRRADQLREMGRDADEARLLREIIERDRSDSERTDGPLVCPADAVRIDTGHMSVEEVVATLERRSRERLGDRLQAAVGAPRRGRSG